MAKSKGTIRYAKALIGLSIENNLLEESYEDMKLLNKTCARSKEFTLLLKSPVVKTDQKIKIIDKIFSKQINKLTLMFIHLIANKKREGLLLDISNDFITLYKKHKKIETATVKIAKPMEEELRKEVINFIKKNGEENVELEEIVDEKIIGGVIVRMGNKQLDASVSSIISELKQTVNQNLYIKDF